MKLTVVFDIEGNVNEWHFAQYLAEILEIPQEYADDPYWIKGIDAVRIGA